MRKIIFLAADRKPAQKCLKLILKAEQQGVLKLEAVVSEASLMKKNEKLFKRRVVFLNNDKKNEDEIYQLIKDYEINLLISIQHKWIISEKIINAVNGFAFNIHFGKLPNYRGHHTHIYPLLNGEKNITTTLHWMKPEVDTGFIAFKEDTPIKNDDTSWSLMQKATDVSIKLFKRFITYLADNKQIPKIPIKGKGHFYSENSIFDLKEISSIENSGEIDKKSRAFYYPPHEPAYFLLNGRKFYVIPKVAHWANAYNILNSRKRRYKKGDKGNSQKRIGMV